MSKRKPPISDREILELLAEEPELLAVTDAIHATYRPSPKLARPVLLLVSAIVVAIVAAIAWPRDSGLVESALAAVGSDSIIHSVVQRYSPRTTLVELRSGRVVRGLVEVETWFDTRTGRLRTATRRDGVVVSDAVSRQPGATPGAPDGEHAQLLTQSYRSALAEGSARETVQGEVGSHEVVWLELTGAGRYRVAVETDNYEPVAFEHVGGGPRWTVTALESVPATAGLFTPPPQREHPVAGHITSSERINLVGAARFPWALAAGKRVGAYRLRSVHLQQLSRRTSHGRRGSGIGLEVIYGRASRLVIRLAPAPEPAYRFIEGRLTFDFNAIPKAGRVAVIAPARGEDWFGQLRLRNTYVSIVAPTRASLLAAARALRPL
jgi:hypothetical protein